LAVDEGPKTTRGFVTTRRKPNVPTPAQVLRLGRDIVIDRQRRSHAPRA
jgi:hypothetical protein